MTRFFSLISLVLVLYGCHSKESVILDFQMVNGNLDSQLARQEEFINGRYHKIATLPQAQSLDSTIKKTMSLLEESKKYLEENQVGPDDNQITTKYFITDGNGEKIHEAMLNCFQECKKRCDTDSSKIAIDETAGSIATMTAAEWSMKHFYKVPAAASQAYHTYHQRNLTQARAIAFEDILVHEQR